MAEINLLDNEQQNSIPNSVATQILLTRILTVILMVVLAFAVFIWFESSSSKKAADRAEAKFKAAESETLNNPQRLELITRQGQMKEFEKLYSGHVYWSYLLPELARITLKTARYTAVSAEKDGKISLEVVVPAYEDLEKFIQVFDLPEYNKEFSNVKLMSVNKSQQSDSGITQVKAKLELNFNPAYITLKQ